MLTALKHFLHFIVAPILYFGTLVTIFVTIVKDAKWGLFFLVAFIPQPNIWYKLRPYPGGDNFIDLVFFAVVLGMIFQGKGFSKTKALAPLVFFVLLNYLALWNSSIRFSLPVPLTTSNELFVDWKNYAQMICLYFLVLNTVKEEKQQKALVVVMALVVLFIAIRCFRNYTPGTVFSYHSRVAGPFEALGLGANHLAAFIVYTNAVFLGLYFFDNDKRRKWLYAVTGLFSLHPLFFAYSRGGYLATMGVIAFYGLLKKRSLLVLCVLLVFLWQTVLPASVVDRIEMTETASGQLEGSAEARLDLWDHAYGLFTEHPVFGVGFGGFGYTIKKGRLTDTHSFYMKALSEQGVIGLLSFLVVLFAAMRSGWLLYRRSAGRPFYQGLGFGFMGCIIALAIKNVTGDSWSFFAVNGYFWVFWGLVDRGVLIVGQAGSVKDSNAKGAAPRLIARGE